jgi:hypothetical protein
MADDAHAWIATDADDSTGHLVLAAALFAENAPADSVNAALEAAWRGVAPDDLKMLSNSTRYNMAMRDGDFGAAQAAMRELENDLGPSPNITARFSTSTGLWVAAQEAGDVGLARNTALGFVQRADAWTATSPEELAMPAAMLLLLRSSGGIDRDTFVKKRAEHLARAEAALARSDDAGGTSADRMRRMVWFYGYALAAETPDDARAAIDALARYPALADVSTMQSVNAGTIGRVFWLAGENERAIPYLRRGAVTCYLLNSVPHQVYARLWLAGALAATGARDEARSLYQGIIDQWGAAKLRSATVAKARAALAALAR